MFESNVGCYRSYYKCTFADCNVKKHVERASDDLNSVITTYEGKHTHEVPTRKTSANARSKNVGTTTTTTSVPRPVLQSDPAMTRVPYYFSGFRSESLIAGMEFGTGLEF